MKWKSPDSKRCPDARGDIRDRPTKQDDAPYFALLTRATLDFYLNCDKVCKSRTFYGILSNLPQN
jgi:hypothetical protein